MQTSFMHPPFGFALFYLRSVAPATEYTDRITGRRIAPVTIGDIYRGAIPFVVIQLIMVTLVIGFPGLVTGGLDRAKKIDLDTIKIEAPGGGYGGYGSESGYGGHSNEPPAPEPAPAEQPGGGRY